MVEKIIINPNKVRGYGNIMSPHSSTDYEVYMSSITSGTDTVNGQTMTVYELEDTILFFDKGTTTSHNDNWEKTSNVTLVRDENYTTVSNSSGTSAQYKPDNWALYSGDIAIEWDNWATTYNNDYFIVTGASDLAKTFSALYIDKACHVKITIIGTTCKCYIDGVEKYSYTINRDSNNKVKVRLQINSGGNDIKYSNFRIYSID